MAHLAQDPTPRSWRFTCPLAYVLVDGKQIAHGEVDLVVKCEARKSPAFGSRHVEQPTPTRHSLMVYVAKEADPKVKSWAFLNRLLPLTLADLVSPYLDIVVPGWLSHTNNGSNRYGFDAVLGTATPFAY
jgi:hypothetical protein